jgi:rare lipoprotein A
MSNGCTFHAASPTAASPDIPLGSWVRVTNLRNGKSLIVRVEDRGPYVKGRIIDLSHAAAVRLDMVKDGVVPVTVQILRTEPVKPCHRAVAGSAPPAGHPGGA